MTESHVQLIHRAIRGERAALRGLLERYQGVSYALAFRATHSFPNAQRVARAAWPLVVQRLPKLAETEGFVELLAQCVEKAACLQKPQPGDDEPADGGGHSILKTEKVLARRSLRQGLADCPLPETIVFFLRHVEGLAVSEIAGLLGADDQEILESLRRVAVDVGYRAGFAGTPGAPPDPATLSPLRRDSLGLAVTLAEGGMSYARRAELEKFIQNDPDARREDEAVRTVLGLAAGTFSAHRLGPDFVREALLQIPYADPPKQVAELPVPLRRTGATQVLRTEVRHGAQLALCLVAALVGLILTLILLDRIGYSGLGMSLATWSAGRTPSLTATILALGIGIVAMVLARPPFTSALPRLPHAYFLTYGVSAGAALAILCVLLFNPYNAPGMYTLALEILLPIWGVTSVGMVLVRQKLAYRDLERRLEARLRIIEDATGMDPAAVAAELQPPAQEAPPVATPLPSKS